MILDATTQWSYVGTPVVEIDGESAGSGVDGLTVTSGNSTIRGLAITDFTGDGIKLSTAGNNTSKGTSSESVRLVRGRPQV